LGDISWVNDTRAAIVFTQVLAFLPYMLVPVSESLARIPRQLTEAARVLGRSRTEALWSVSLPQLKTSFLVGGILIFVESINEVGANTVLQPFGYSSLSLRVFSQLADSRPQDAATWVLVTALVCAYPLWILSNLLDTNRNADA